MKQFYETYAKMPFVSSVMTQLQTPENQSDKIVSSPMTQLEWLDISESILSKLSWTQFQATSLRQN